METGENLPFPCSPAYSKTRNTSALCANRYRSRALIGSPGWMVKLSAIVFLSFAKGITLLASIWRLTAQEECKQRPRRWQDSRTRTLVSERRGLTRAFPGLHALCEQASRHTLTVAACNIDGPPPPRSLPILGPRLPAGGPRVAIALSTIRRSKRAWTTAAFMRMCCAFSLSRNW